MKASPRYLSPIPEGTDIEAAHIGARLQRLPMTPQGELMAGVLEAKDQEGMPLYGEVVFEVPRRSTKTTSVQNVLLGRCATIPGYVVVSTAQDGTRASEFMADLMDQIENHANEIVEQRNNEREEEWEAAGGEGDEPKEFLLKDALAELGIRQLYRSQGREFIRWRNGSKWKAVPPEAPKLRGKGVRVVWFDEAGELDPEQGPALLAGALPMLDTNPDAQIIVSGTPGPQRAGMFWEQLEEARKNPAVRGIVDYTAERPDGTYADPNDEDTWWETHPGLACGLTTIKVIRKRHGPGGLALPKFMMEYLCIWPPDSNVTALKLRNWDATKDVHLAEPPEGVPWGIGYDVAIGGHVAAVAVAWIDERGEPWGQVMLHKPGMQWLPANLGKASAKFPRVKIGYDSIGDNISVAQACGRLPRFRTQSLKPLQLKEIAAATALIATSVDNMTIHHAEHSGLDNAVKNATWREGGGHRLFMRSKGQEISCLLALAAALAVASTAPRNRSSAGTGRVPQPVAV